MLIKPPLNLLLTHVDNRYMLACVAAKRARQITEKDISNDEEDTNSPVTDALEEILSGKTKYIRTKEGIK